MADASWSFDQIAEDDPTRAKELENAPSAQDLRLQIITAFRRELEAGNVRFGWETSEQQPDDCRAVLQFHVDALLFDKFFNARTGYRAQFRVSPEAGLEYNKTLVEGLRHDLQANTGPVVKARLMAGEFEDAGPVEVPIAQLIASLDPHYAKIWWCTKLIQPARGTPRYLPLGVGPPRLVLRGVGPWAAPHPEDENSWIDVKGAFLGAGGPYQPKCPIYRAKILHSWGEA